MKYMLPSLHLSLPFISNPSDILAYAVRHYLYTPSNVYESFLDYEYTFAKRFAEYNHKPNDLKDIVQQDLETYLSHIFGTSNINVDITTTEIENPNRQKNEEVYKDFYSLNINISIVVNNQQHTISPNIEIDKNRNFTINFNDI